RHDYRNRSRTYLAEPEGYDRYGCAVRFCVEIFGDALRCGGARSVGGAQGGSADLPADCSDNAADQPRCRDAPADISGSVTHLGRWAEVLDRRTCASPVCPEVRRYRTGEAGPDASGSGPRLEGRTTIGSRLVPIERHVLIMPVRLAPGEPTQWLCGFAASS